MQPSFSVEGDELWFLTSRRAAEHERYRLHVYPASGSGRGRSSPVAALTGTPVGAFRVSPDGDRVAIGPSFSCAPGVVLGRNGEQMAELSEPGGVEAGVFSWSRDGSRLLYSLARDPYCGRYGQKPVALLIHRPGTGHDRLLTAPRDMHVGSSAWSPDDSRIALTECKNEEDWSCRLVIIDASGRGRRVLANLVSGVAWAVPTNEIVTSRRVPTDPYGKVPTDPDGNEITQVWAFNPDSGAGRKISDSGSVVASSRDGSLIADIDGVLDVETGRRWRFPASVERRSRFGRRTPPDAYFIGDREKQ